MILCTGKSVLTKFLTVLYNVNIVLITQAFWMNLTSVRVGFIYAFVAINLLCFSIFTVCALFVKILANTMMVNPYLHSTLLPY